MKKEKKVKEIAINATDEPFIEEPRAKPNRNSVVMLDQIFPQPKPAEKPIEPPKPESEVIKEEPEGERQSVKQQVTETKMDKNIPPTIVE